MSVPDEDWEQHMLLMRDAGYVLNPPEYEHLGNWTRVLYKLASASHCLKTLVEHE